MTRTPRGNAAGWARAGLSEFAVDAEESVEAAEPSVSRETSSPDSVEIVRNAPPVVHDAGMPMPADPADLQAVQDAVREAMAHPLTREAPHDAPAPPPPPPMPTRPTVDLGGDTPIGRAAESAVRVMSGRAGDPLPRPARTRVFTVANQKGGVGKTTTAVNVAAGLALHGLRVLVVDLDPQGNASTALGVPHHADVPSVYDVLIDGMALADVVQPAAGVPNLFCAPATIDLAGAEIELVSLVARETRLQRAIDAYNASLEDRLDYVIIDCPPSLGLLTVNAFVAAEEVLIPIQCEYYALEGLGQLLKNVEMVKAHLNPRLNVTTILLTMYDGRTRLASQVANEVREHFGPIVLRTAIPRSVRISEAPSYQQTVITYDAGSTGALCYLEAAREIALAAQTAQTGANAHPATPVPAFPSQEGS